jgi:hypothetical protein
MIAEQPKGPQGPHALVACDLCFNNIQLRCDYNRRGSRWSVDIAQVRRKLVGMGWRVVKRSDVCPSCLANGKEAAPHRSSLYGKTPLRDPPPPDVPALPPELLPAPPPHPSFEQPFPSEDSTMASPPPKTTHSPPSASTAVAAAADGLREPTIEQNRAICAMLDLAYDTKAGRYFGEETDFSIADALSSDGVMAGWVTRLRETLYGKGAGNEEQEKVGPDLSKLCATLDEQIGVAMAMLAEATKLLEGARRDREKLRDMEARLGRIKKSLGPKGASL